MKTSLLFAVILTLGLSCEPAEAQEATSGWSLTAGDARAPARVAASRLKLDSGYFGAQVVGEIRGVVVTAAGKPLADQRVELRLPGRMGSGRLVTTTDASGSFVYRGLSPGRYEVEVRIDGRGTATSGPIELSAKRMQVHDVTLVRPAPGSGRIRAGELLKGEPVTESFEVLRPLLEPGYEVIVWGNRGAPTRGKVTSISSDALVIVSNGQSRTFAEEFVRRIDIVDPIGNGVRNGLAVAAALVAGAAVAESGRAPSNLNGVLTMMAVMIGVPAGTIAGGLMDRSTNEPIFQRPTRTRMTVAPVFGSTAKGIRFSLAF